MSEDVRAQIGSIVREVYEQAEASGVSTRGAAIKAVSDLPDGPLLRRLAAEFIVEGIARAARAKTLTVEREAASSGALHESPSRGGRMPRKGTHARYVWETTTEEGRKWAREEEESRVRSDQMFYGVLGKALERYTEDLRVQWTAELLDSTFTLTDGTPVTWGDATAEQHAERRQMFLNNAHVNMEGAARHDMALRQLADSGCKTLREMAKVAA